MKVVNANTFADGIAGLQYDVISAFQADQGIIHTFGEEFVRGNALASSIMAVVGMKDGNMTPSNWLDAASAIAGDLGIIFNATPVGFVCDGLSLVLAVGSFIESSREQNNNY